MAEEMVYPPVEPFNTGLLEVSPVHKVYYEESGNKTGIPVVFIHGGPGGSTSDWDRRYFDPKAYRIILLDQRGCGKSTPAFCLEENDTWKLIQDMEKLREHLGIAKWLVFGTSWGSTLALIYAERHIDHVLGLIIQGVFTFRKEEFDWLYQSGASYLFPEYWDEFVAPIPEGERDNLFAAFYKRMITGNDLEEAKRCARAMAIWDSCNTRLKVNPEKVQKAKEMDAGEILKAMKVGCYYMANNGFLKNEIWEGLGIIKESGIPVHIVQGRYDVVAPMKTAWEVRKMLPPQSEFVLVEGAGHSPKEEEIAKALVEATDKFKDKLKGGK